jgi:hypothetical protein
LIARKLPGVHVEVDGILSAILPNSDRCLQDRLLAYGISARAIKPILDRYRTAILDCTYSRRAFRSQVTNNIRTDDILVVIEFLVRPEVALARFRKRGEHAAIDSTEDLVLDRAKSYPYGCGSGAVNSEQPMESIQDQVVRVLKNAPALNRATWVEGGV